MKAIKFLIILPTLIPLVSCEDKFVLETDTEDIIYVTALPFENSSLKIEQIADSLPSASLRIPCGGTTYGDLYFINEKIGISVLNGYQFYKVFQTTDGGLSWKEKFSFPYRVTNFSFDPLTPDTGYIIGGGYNNSGFLAKTTDGGETWTFVYEDGTFPFDNITIVNNKILLSGTWQNVSGDTDISKIIRSDDGGTTWTTVYEESGDINDRIASSGFVLGSQQSFFIKFFDNRLSISTDYGASWSQKLNFPIKNGNYFSYNHVLVAEDHYFSYGDLSDAGETTKNSVAFKGTNGVDKMLLHSDSSYYGTLPGLATGYRYSVVDKDNDGGRINSGCESPPYSYRNLIAYEDSKTGKWKEIHIDAIKGFIHKARGYEWDNNRQRFKYYYLVGSGRLFKVTLK